MGDTKRSRKVNNLALGVVMWLNAQSPEPPKQERGDQYTWWRHKRAEQNEAINWMAWVVDEGSVSEEGLGPAEKWVKDASDPKRQERPRGSLVVLFTRQTSFPCPHRFSAFSPSDFFVYSLLSYTAHPFHSCRQWWRHHDWWGSQLLGQTPRLLHALSRSISGFRTLGYYHFVLHLLFQWKQFQTCSLVEFQDQVE